MKSGSAAAIEQEFKTCKLSTLFPTGVTFQLTLFTSLSQVCFVVPWLSFLLSLLRFLLTSILLGMPEESIGRPEEQLHHPHAPY